MFKIPIKKVRGIEKGSFVVLSVASKEHAITKNTAIREDRRLYANKYVELMYVINDDLMHDNKFAKVIPVIFNKDNKWQNHSGTRKALRKRITYTYIKSDLRSVLINPLEYVENEFLINRPVTKRVLSRINSHYQKVFAENKLSAIDLDVWEGR